MCRWWREAEGFQGRFAVIFPIDRENVTFVASAPIAELHKQGLPFNPDEPRSVQADLANADNLQRCMTVFHDFDERLLTVLLSSSLLPPHLAHVEEHSSSYHDSCQLPGDRNVPTELGHLRA